MSADRPGGFRIFITVMVALLLALVPLPPSVNAGRPDWLLLVVIYWSLTTPRISGLFFAFVCGLLMDVSKGVLIGQHALGFVLVGYVTHRLQLRMRIFPIWQQTFTVLMMLGVYHFVVFWIDGIIGLTAVSWWRWLPVLTGAIFWPILVAVMDTVNRKSRS